jgi:PadR family transcriptional regulator, regulatory protein PadR
MARPDELTSTEALILGVLQNHARGLHGVAIVEDLSAQTEGHYVLAFGTLYPALQRLEKKGFLKGTWEDLDTATAEGRPRRRIWTITALGKKALQEARELVGLQWRVLNPQGQGT